MHVANQFVESNYTCRVDDSEVDYPKKQKPKEEDAEEKMYGTNYSTIEDRDEYYYSTTWGPVGFKKSNHPLAIMVNSKIYTNQIIISHFLL